MPEPSLEGRLLPETPILSGWKEISLYLGKGVRTVQRWENEFGLPVRRIHDKSPKASVMAFRTEIDGWIRARQVGGESHESERVPRLLQRVEELQLEIVALRRQVEAGRTERAVDPSARRDAGKRTSSISGRWKTGLLSRESSDWAFRPPNVVPTAAEKVGDRLVISFSDGTSKSYPPEPAPSGGSAPVQ